MRACVNDSVQQSYILKESAASPMVMTDSLSIVLAIDVHKERHAITLDIQGAFLHADLDKEIIMLL